MEALEGTARKLWDFAKAHGLREDWHEPDEQDIDAAIINPTAAFDNAMGDDPYELAPEMIVRLYKVGGNSSVVINLATLCALATIGAGVVLGETKPFPGLVTEQGKPIQPPNTDLPRFSLNELSAILSTVLKSIGES